MTVYQHVLPGTQADAAAVLSAMVFGVDDEDDVADAGAGGATPASSSDSRGRERRCRRIQEQRVHRAEPSLRRRT